MSQPREEWEPEPRQIYNVRTRRWEREGTPVTPLTPVGQERLMPFGKYAGLALSEVETGYLKWCLRDCDLDDGLREAITEELRQR